MLVFMRNGLYSAVGAIWLLRRARHNQHRQARDSLSLSRVAYEEANAIIATIKLGHFPLLHLVT